MKHSSGTLNGLKRILSAHRELYQRVEDEIRRAVLRRFPYSLFYVIEQDLVVVLACMHHHQKPRTRNELLGV